MLTLDRHVRPYPAVVDTALDTGETVLLHLERQTYFSLNATGTRIWQGLTQGLTLRAVSRQLQATDAVEAAHAERSVLTLVTELLAQLWVQRTAGNAPKAEAS